MTDLQHPQSVVGIVGRGTSLTVRSRQPISVEILDAPEGMRPRRAVVVGMPDVVEGLNDRTIVVPLSARKA
jgi:hypothetical protein